MSNTFARRMDRLEERDGGNPLGRLSDAHLNARLLDLAPRALADSTMAEHHAVLREILTSINGGAQHA